MLWKPSAVQLRNVKQKNAGSFFTAKQVKDSAALKQAGLAEICFFVHFLGLEDNQLKSIVDSELLVGP